MLGLRNSADSSETIDAVAKAAIVLLGVEESNSNDAPELRGTPTVTTVGTPTPNKAGSDDVWELGDNALT